jgi:uncharacterized heparinase superfamily protein
MAMMDMPSPQEFSLKRFMKSELGTYESFPAAGYTVIRGKSGLTFTFDHGPLGMAPLYNHGHADALSITLSVNSRALLVDPGTYRYNGVPEYRRYFRGTRAHNTVTVDGEDQAVQETGFIWSHPFKATLVRASDIGDGFILEGHHDGYWRLKNPVRHQRTVLFWGGGNFLIRDTFPGKGTHDFEVNYHLHPDAKASQVNGWWLVEGDGKRIFIQLMTGDNLTLIKGQENPPFGWFSPSYGIKRESGVLTCAKRMQVRDASFLVAICADSPVDLNVLNKKAELM